MWWGNTIYAKTALYKGAPRKKVATGEVFDPTSW
jgi:hypothetical protein